MTSPKNGMPTAMNTGDFKKVNKAMYVRFKYNFLTGKVNSGRPR